MDGSHPAAPSRLTLLAFLDGSAPTRDTPSKQQIPAIRSMATQFGPRGLSVRYVIANQSTATPGERTSALNLAADWQLTAPPLQLTRTELASLLAQFRITTLPATVLISTDAAHPHIWLGRVGPAQLGPAVSQASS